METLRPDRSFPRAEEEEDEDDRSDDGCGDGDHVQGRLHQA
jgi:hypothetical protein